MLVDFYSNFENNPQLRMGAQLRAPEPLTSRWPKVVLGSKELYQNLNT